MEKDYLSSGRGMKTNIFALETLPADLFNMDNTTENPKRFVALLT